MALAPARMVARMVSSVGPPVAMMGTSGNCLRIWATISGVRAAPETFRMSAPASRRAWISVLSATTVTTTGMSTSSLIMRTTSLGMGAFSTTPKAPWCSAWMARRSERIPLVTPPPTPTKTGTSATLMMASAMTGWGVKG